MSTAQNTKTAKRMQQIPDFKGDAAVYELTPPLEREHGGSAYTHVVVSAITEAYDTGMPETMIFPSDGEDVSDWGDLATVHHCSHSDALAELGYEVAA